MKFLLGLFQYLRSSVLFNPAWVSECKLRHEIESIIKRIAPNNSSKWLDVGCGLRPYESYFPLGVYVGVDVESSGRDDTLKAPDYFYDGKVLPFQNNSFDGVICTQVLEHVPDPRGVLSEIYRVTNVGGELILSLPFVWQEHEEPYDYFRFTSFGITELLKQAGFEVNSIIKDTGAIETLVATLNVYLMHNCVFNSRFFGRLIALLVCFPLQMFALISQKILPDKGQLYLNLIIYAKK